MGALNRLIITENLLIQIHDYLMKIEYPNPDEEELLEAVEEYLIHNDLIDNPDKITNGGS